MKNKNLKEKRNYKDSVFVDLFGRCPEARANFLSLYNAIHETDLKLEETKITPITLDQTIYTGRYNDVSMLINDKMITMVEQQSTINMNMPLRFLEYLTRIYEKIIPQENRYKKHLVKIPMPEFYVLYNGQEHIPNEMTLKLSDAFINDSQTRKFPLELTVKVFKIQGVGNVPILQKCAVLSDYSKLIDYVQQARMSGIETPLDYAVQRCIKEKILPDYLKKNSTEVRNMLIGEYDYATDIRVQRQEAREEGVEAGIAYQSAKYEKIIAEITSQKDAEIERLKKALEEMKTPK